MLTVFDKDNNIKFFDANALVAVSQVNEGFEQTTFYKDASGNRYTRTTYTEVFHDGFSEIYFGEE